MSPGNDEAERQSQTSQASADSSKPAVLGELDSWLQRIRAPPQVLGSTTRVSHVHFRGMFQAAGHTVEGWLKLTSQTSLT